MADIKAFRGLRYNKEFTPDLSCVLAPPYDSIDEEERQVLYGRDRHNIVRIQSGLRLEEDDENNNCYTRAKEYFSEWIENGILKRDEAPAIYLYNIPFSIHSEKYSFAQV